MLWLFAALAVDPARRQTAVSQAPLHRHVDDAPGAEGLNLVEVEVAAQGDLTHGSDQTDVRGAPSIEELDSLMSEVTPGSTALLELGMSKPVCSWQKGDEGVDVSGRGPAREVCPTIKDLKLCTAPCAKADTHAIDSASAHFDVSGAAGDLQVEHEETSKEIIERRKAWNVNTETAKQAIADLKEELTKCAEGLADLQKKREAENNEEAINAAKLKWDELVASLDTARKAVASAEEDKKKLETDIGIWEKIMAIPEGVKSTEAQCADLASGFEHPESQPKMNDITELAAIRKSAEDAVGTIEKIIADLRQELTKTEGVLADQGESIKQLEVEATASEVLFKKLTSEREERIKELDRKLGEKKAECDGKLGDLKEKMEEYSGEATEFVDAAIEEEMKREITYMTSIKTLVYTEFKDLPEAVVTAVIEEDAAKLGALDEATLKLGQTKHFNKNDWDGVRSKLRKVRAAQRRKLEAADLNLSPEAADTLLKNWEGLTWEGEEPHISQDFVALAEKMHLHGASRGAIGAADSTPHKDEPHEPNLPTIAQEIRDEQGERPAIPADRCPCEAEKPFCQSKLYAEDHKTNVAGGLNLQQIAGKGDCFAPPGGMHSTDMTKAAWANAHRWVKVPKKFIASNGGPACSEGCNEHAPGTTSQTLFTLDRKREQ